MAVEAPISSFDRIEAVMRNEAIYELAKLVPQHEEGDEGRPRQFPDYMLFVFDALISVFGSTRKVEAELSHDYVWRFMRRLAKKLHPDQPEMRLPPYRYKRHHYTYGRNRYLTDTAILEQIQERHRKLAAEQARELGLLDEKGEGSFTRPSLDRLIYGDGKVVAPLYKAKPGDAKVNKETGEVRQLRYEADAELHMQGDGEMAWGCKFVMTAVRTNDVHGRIILDAQHVIEKGGEARTAMKSFKAVAPHAPGIQGAIYDGAFRGTHHNELMQRLGWLSINRVQAKEVITRDGKPVKRTEKAIHLEDKVVNGKTVRLYARAGAVCIAELDYNGGQQLIELRRVRTTRRDGKAGTFRWYNEYELPGGGTVTVRIDTTEDDKARNLNRAENVRQLAPSDRDFKRIYRRRADIESINRGLDDSMWLGRAHSKGAKRQLMNIIGFALMVNGLAVYLHRTRRSADGPEGNSPPGEAAA